MIRHADSCDFHQMAQLSQDATAAHWAEDVYQNMLKGEGPQRLLLVAEEAGELCGLLVALRETSDWELENIVVASHRRRRGIGGDLMDELIAKATVGGAEKILLEVRASNVAAISLYQSCGLEIWSTRKSYYSNPLEDAVLMIKKIGKSALEIS